MSIASRRVAKLDARYRADVKLLNESGVHIVMRRDAQGRPAPITSETIHALAEVVRCLNKSKGSSEDSST